MITNTYIKDILIPASQAMKKHFGNDGAEDSNQVKWCRANFLNFWSKEMCPPASPDLNLLNFNIWSILEAEACAKTHDIVEGLKVSLKKAWVKIPQEKLHVSVESFRGRLERVVKARRHIEI